MYKGLALSAALILLLLGGLCGTITTHTFLRPVSYTVDASQVTFVRDVPFGGVRANWWTEMAVVQADGVLECSASGQAFYQDEPGRTVKYFASGALLRCLDEPGDLVIRQKWQALLFGVIPLLPHSQTFTIPEQFR